MPRADCVARLLDADTLVRMKHRVVRSVALVAILSMSASCAVTRQNRNIAVIGGVVVTVGAATVAMSRLLATCDAQPNGDSQACENSLIDDRNTAAGVALVGLVATLIALALPVSDPERPPPSAVAIAPPPPPSEQAAQLHSPAALQLARRAQLLASDGKCVEAFGSLGGLAQIDKPMADQLLAWDPSVSRCRTARAANGSQTAVIATTPVRAPAVASPAGPGAQPPSE
jgi:hypothetical protein